MSPTLGAGATRTVGTPKIDLNSDLGEGSTMAQMARDRAILSVVSSANIACGFHAGDTETMSETVRNASEYGVTVGAHVSYYDREGFGRRELNISTAKLKSDLAYQIGALKAITTLNGTTVSYIKPHGALYNRIAYDDTQARAVVETIATIDSRLVLLTLPGSVAMQVAQELGICAIAEGFADRAYTDDGRLVPRTIPGSVITDPDEVVQRALQMARDGTVTSSDGKVLRLDARSICLHSDTDGAAALSQQIRLALEFAGITVTSFIPTC
ncbi:MAG: LamB/YcsF family protein [Ferrimicrobium sp.]|uniref:LamB/YcsF family protein n=1 Tax=Ferrimicrobium acidiphilum TaxID=121039 RepID=A0ABV3Y6M3_9ACTN|nr:5-oxoprolinase subunit PxpA [Ferrimicrobium sp.]